MGEAKHMRNALTLAAGLMLAASFLVAPTAMAQQPAMVIAYLDKTGDGKVDLNEYLTYQQPRLAEFDKDADGELNLGEFRESLQGKAKMNANAVFKGANAEGGRSLTQREFLGYHAFVFKQYIDTNSDGFMSAEEWQKIVGAG
jgi:Ca2+-binding EF-hand superfamily protein